MNEKPTSWALARQIFYAVLGAPDYERYLEHFARAHPGEQPLSRAEFYRERVARPSARC